MAIAGGGATRARRPARARRRGDGGGEAGRGLARDGQGRRQHHRDGRAAATHRAGHLGAAEAAAPLHEARGECARGLVCGGPVLVRGDRLRRSRTRDARMRPHRNSLRRVRVCVCVPWPCHVCALKAQVSLLLGFFYKLLNY